MTHRLCCLRTCCLLLCCGLLTWGCTSRNPHYPDSGQWADQAGLDRSLPRPDLPALRPDRNKPLLDGPALDGPAVPDQAPPLDGPALDKPTPLDTAPLDFQSSPVDGPLPDKPPVLQDSAPLDKPAPKPDLPGCPTGLTLCGVACVDLQRDPDNCGKCGGKCGPGTGCLTGSCAHSSGWRSSLYPLNWKPGFQDKAGRFLHDFSYAGYHMGDLPIPDKYPGKWYVVTTSPYNADNTGKTDATQAIQKALDDAGKAGGGVVLLPAGTYRVKPLPGDYAALHMSYDKVVLRGAGRHQTFIFNDEPKMRSKVILYARPAASASWTSPSGAEYYLSANAPNGTNEVQVATTSAFKKGDLVVVRADATATWVMEHNMSGTWSASNVHGPMFLRRVAGTSSGKVTLDIPLRATLLTRDGARIYRAKAHLREIGMEDFSMGNREHPGAGWGDNDYNTSSKAAYDVHASRAISMAYVVDGWIRRVSSYRPPVNKKLVHTLSDGVQLYMSRNITVQDCFFAHPQYEGGGGNGYTFVMQGSDNLLRGCASVSARHAYSFKSMQTTGNVIRDGSSSAPRLATDFHMHLSAANLLDGLTMDKDFIDATYRPYGTTIHGHTTTQTAIWNTLGVRHHASASWGIVDSRQFDWGVVVGTRGAAYGVRTLPTTDTKTTAPEDLSEGVGGGGSLQPGSLYADQLTRRKAGGAAPKPGGPRLVFLEPVADSYVRDGANAGKNFGTDQVMVAKVSTPNNGYNRVALLRFDLSKVTGPVARARLVVYGKTADGGGTHVGVAAHGVTDDSWSEKGVTWNNQPKRGPYQSHLVVDNKDAWRVLDVTPFVRHQQASDGVVTLSLAETVGGTGLVALFNTREASTSRPRLELTLVPGKVMPIKAITSSSAAASGTSAAFTVDGKLSTRFSSDMLGAQITYDLGSAQTVTHLGVAHQSGDQRIPFYEAWTSLDNKAWTPLRGAHGDGNSLGMIFTELPPTQARYIRYVGLGNSDSAWSSITEVVIIGQ